MQNDIHLNNDWLPYCTLSLSVLCSVAKTTLLKFKVLRNLDYASMQEVSHLKNHHCVHLHSVDFKTSREKICHTLNKEIIPISLNYKSKVP